MAPDLGADEISAITDRVAQGWITEGPKSEEFVKGLNELIGVPYGVLAPNGTLALALGLLALGVGPGDEVMVPDVTFMGSATAVILCGAKPVCVDVDGEFFLFDAKRLKNTSPVGPRRSCPSTCSGFPAIWI